MDHINLSNHRQYFISLLLQIWQETFAKTIAWLLPQELNNKHEHLKYHDQFGWENSLLNKQTIPM